MIFPESVRVSHCVVYFQVKCPNSGGDGLGFCRFSFFFFKFLWGQEPDFVTKDTVADHTLFPRLLLSCSSLPRVNFPYLQHKYILE